jgi:hypothetical membrane protein
MDSKDELMLKIAGVIGIVTPIATFTLILLAISSVPQFSWTENALSDLGVESGITAMVFNVALIACGLLLLIFASGLNMLLQKTVLGKIGAFVFAIDFLALTTIGVFPENIKPATLHYYVSVAFFALFPLSMFFITVGFLRTAKMKLGLFTLLAALVAVAIWVVQFTLHLFSNVAIPETVAALSASAWVIVLGSSMLKEASH